MGSMELDELSELFHTQLSIPYQFPEKTRLQGGMIRYREGFSGRIDRMSEANMAAALPDDLVTKLLKGLNRNPA